MTTETETIERMVKEERKVFRADDGTKFYNEEECKTYEDGAAFACKVAIKNILKQVDNDKIFKELYMDGCGDDYETYIFRPKTTEDVKTFLQWTKVTKVPVKTKPETLSEYESYSKFMFAEEIVPGDEYVVFHHEDYWCGVSSLKYFLNKTVAYCAEIIKNI